MAEFFTPDEGDFSDEVLPTEVPEDYPWDVYIAGYQTGLDAGQTIALGSDQETQEQLETLDYSEDLHLIARNQVNSIAVLLALVFVLVGVLIGKELLKIWVHMGG